jgi:hypothetical protein
VRGRSGVEDRVRVFAGRDGDRQRVRGDGLGWAGLGWICMATNETKTISVDKRIRKDWINEMDTQDKRKI